ncbi:MAG: hypothetical protein AB2707_08560, partial [Candidatus Thiodiazotropha sp.]
MERALIVTDGTFAGADASAYLKRVLLLSSLPALAGGLWRFAPLPGFPFIEFLIHQLPTRDDIKKRKCIEQSSQHSKITYF